ncbi:hypothetical protein AAEX63_16145 [Luteococcus sp. H138]|uniref:hypothetical protein n=1 Tax=unclassified Luteococcus TaxID=2639923 RepID=UPI00313EE173
MNNPYSSVPVGSDIVVLGSLVEDEQGCWLSYPVDSSGGVGRSYGAVLTSIADPELARQLAAAGLVAATGRWDGHLMRLTGFEPVAQDWTEHYRNFPGGLTPEEAADLVNGTPAELEETINAVEHFHPDGWTRKIRISITLATPEWDAWQATVEPWVEVIPLMYVLT